MECPTGSPPSFQALRIGQAAGASSPGNNLIGKDGGGSSWDFRFVTGLDRLKHPSFFKKKAFAIAQVPSPMGF